MAGAIVRQVDHVIIQTDWPQPLFSLFSETLQLPTAWPLTSYGRFMSGGIGVGAANIEVMCIAPKSVAPDRPSARLAGIALEPAPLADAIAELDTRGINYGEPEPPHPSKEHEQPWTEVPLADLCRGAYIFLCEYSFDIAKRRARVLDQLQASDGGPLGVRSIKEIAVGVSEYETVKRRWEQLLSPTRSDAESTWHAGNGPAITLVPADEDGIKSIIFQAASLERARTFLASNGLLGEADGSQVTIAPLAVQGLDLRLTQR